MDAESVFVYPRDGLCDRSTVPRSRVAARAGGTSMNGWRGYRGAHHARRTMASVFGSCLGLELSRGASL
ncbi:hypothetical protein N9M16_07480 [Candidatus Dependentiae bacterium]|jgi:hypothetical protein|nr:hypothetical protein [Candidatus Dependentiae bacterium]